MSEFKSAGQVAFEVYQRGFAPPFDWDAQNENERKIWDQVAASVIDWMERTEPEFVTAEKVEPDYLQATPKRMEVHEDPNAVGYLVNLQLAIPASDRFHEKPGSNKPRIASLLKLVEGGHHLLRIQAVTSREIESTFARMQDDGTVRGLLPDEASW